MGALPFSSDAFLGVFEQYNLAIWPAQAVAYLLGVLAVWLVLRPAGTGRVVSGILALFWVFMGVAYHILFFSPINPAAWLFGALFLLQGGLMGWAGLRGRLGFGPPQDFTGWTGLALVACAMVVYPVLAYAAGQVWPAMAVFGVAPCPTTIFTLGMLLLVTGRTPEYLAVIPVLWSLVGGSAVWLLDMPEDALLPLAGAGAAALIVVRNRQVDRAARA